MTRVLKQKRERKAAPVQSSRRTEIELIKPHPGQLRVINERQRFNVVMCGRRWGKTSLGKLLVGDVAIDGYPVAWFAPSYKYLLDVWEGVNEYLAPMITKTNQQDRRIKLSTGGEIDFWTLEDKDAGRGRKYRRVAIDEAGIIKELETIYMHAIRPTLTDLKGDAWFLGTPKGRNFFNACYVRGQNKEPNWASWRFGTVDNPFMDETEVESAKAEMAKYPGAFEQEYLGIPADDGANPFGLAAIRRCIKPLSTKPVACYGVDLAKSYDWTWVIGLDQDGNCCYSERWQGDWGLTRQKLSRLIGDVPTLIDSTGVGDPVVEDLQRMNSAVEGFKYTQQSKQQIMEGLAGAIQNEEIGFCDPILIEELETFEFEYTKMGVRYVCPIGLHDDGVNALALAQRKRTMFGQILQFTVNGDTKPARVATRDTEAIWN